MSVREPWTNAGYGDVEAAGRRDGLLEVAFADGDIVQIDPAALGIGGEFTAQAAEGGAAVLVSTPAGDREIDWTVLRSAADRAFAHELRERDAEEARRIGRRLRALREDRDMSQKAVAAIVGMSAPQLAKLEQGQTDMRISTLRSLLRALGADFADIAGPDAPEVSVKELRRRAGRFGVPAEVIQSVASVVGARRRLDVVARGFGWDPREIVADTLAPPRPAELMVLKRRSTTGDKGDALLALAESLARRGALAYPRTPGAVPADPGELRKAVLGDATEMTLEALLRWCWDAGVVVVPMLGRGAFSAGAWTIGEQPVVVLKEAPDYFAYWLFALAHELGHLARGHVTRRGLVDVERAWEGDDDQQEREANAYALDLLVPGHGEMLDEIRRRSAGPKASEKFKFKAIAAAEERGFNAGLVLLIAAFGLPDVARPGDRWGSANNEAAREGSARRLVAEYFAANVDLERLDRLDALLLQALAIA